MGMLQFFDMILTRENGVKVTVQFMVRGNNELWMLPQNAEWEELEMIYKEAKQALKEGRVFPVEEEKLEPPPPPKSRKLREGQEPEPPEGYKDESFWDKVISWWG